MALNPFFLNGTRSERGLIQSLVSETIGIHGIDVHYIPRVSIRTNKIIEEVESSYFEKSFVIEAYLNNYEGYAPGSDVLTKFGINLSNEITLTLSKERFDVYIAPLVKGIVNATTSGDLITQDRPREGDLIYFPYGKRLFEIKRVESERPFYQLGENYTYELQCELFRIEDEEFNTEIEDLQDKIEDEGHITTLIVVGMGQTATAVGFVTDKSSVSEVTIINGGYGFNSTPTIIIDPPPISSGGIGAAATAIMEPIGGTSVKLKEIVLLNAGFGYDVAPNIQITGGGGLGASANCSIGGSAVYRIDVTSGGSQYYKVPTVTISDPIGGGNTATALANISGGQVTDVYIRNSGSNYVSPPTITIENASEVGSGSFIKNEQVIGQTSGAKGLVKTWTNEFVGADKELTLYKVVGEFIDGEEVVGTASSAVYNTKDYTTYNRVDKLNQNEELEVEGKKILDLTEDNPFGFI